MPQARFAPILITIALLTGSRSASAETFTWGGGVFLGVSLDRGKPWFTWGGELFGTFYPKPIHLCQGHASGGVGPLAQFAFHDIVDPRITLAAHAGGTIESGLPAPGLSGELGGSFFLTRGRFAAHTGFLFEYAPFVNLALRHQLLQNDTSLTAGIRLPATYGIPAICTLD